MIQICVILLRHLDRSGQLHQPGDEISVPMDEGVSMIESGWAAPLGADLRPPARPVVGHFSRPRR